MTRPAVAAVVFDLDGVLLDSEQIWDAVREELVRDWGGRYGPEDQQAMMGMSPKDWPRYMHERLNLAQSPEEIGAEVVRRVQECYRVRLPLLEGAAEAVRRLAAAFPLAIASSSNRSVIDAVLAGSGFGHCFSAVVSSEEVGRGKPAPDVFLEAARRLDIAPEHCAAVEDSGNGIRSAHAAGMFVVALPNPHYPPPEDALRLAGIRLASLHELTPARLRDD